MTCFWVLSLLAVSVAQAQDWPSFLARQDLTWTAPPQKWEEGAFLGNGRIGAMVYQNGVDTLQFDLGRSDITDLRNDPDPLMARPRMPIGRLLMKAGTGADGVSGPMRLDLWNAEATGRRWKAYVHATRPLLVVESEGFWKFQFRPDLSVNPRKIRRKTPLAEGDLNPAPFVEEYGSVRVSVQQRTAGGEYDVAWREIAGQGGHQTFLLSIGEKRKDLVDLLQKVPEATALAAEHRKWWHEYYPQSFVSVPDSRIEAFYWRQIYKLASATRADGVAIDNMGPWYRQTPWPAIWWNLNLQLSYWPVYTANRLDLGRSLLKLIYDHADSLIANVPEVWRGDSAAVGRSSSFDARSPVDLLATTPPKDHPEARELGNLTWALHNCWLHYRYSMDDAMLRDQLYPLLRRSVNYYLHHLRESPNGKLHLPVAISPEYPRPAADTNYDLSLLRWGLQALQESAVRLRIDDPLADRWRDVQVRLADYPAGPDGFWIGSNVPLALSHRHFSHLLMIYPLHLFQDRDVIERSLAHWIGFEGALQGYSFVGASAISSTLGKGDDALRYLNTLITRYVKPNTMYLESGPVIETPLSAAQAVHEMLLQSWGRAIRIFPAVPSAWKQAEFRNLRVEGAFLVGANWKDGRTRSIHLESLAGEPCRIVTDLQQPQAVQPRRGFRIISVSPGTWEIDLRKGESVELVDR